MSTKKRMVLYDSLCILYFLIYGGAVFTGWPLMAVTFVLPLIMLPLIVIRPPEYKMGKARVIIFFVIIAILTVSLIIALKSGIDNKDSALWPVYLKLIFGGGFASLAIIMVSKLLEDMKFIERTEGEK
jgi:hypothetical protein